MKLDLNILFACLIGSAFSGCQSNGRGDLRVINETNTQLFIKFSDNGTDTVIGQLDAGSDFVIRIFEVNGNSTKFNCCPCETNIYSIYSKTKKINKDASKSENWLIPNKSKLKVNGKEPIKCEFHISTEDL